MLHFLIFLINFHILIINYGLVGLGGFKSVFTVETKSSNVDMMKKYQYIQH